MRQDLTPLAQPYSGSRKRSACNLAAWLGFWSTLFSTQVWAVYRRRNA